MEIWLQISAGQGPLECQFAVARLVQVLEAEARSAGLVPRITGLVPGDRAACARSALIHLTGSRREAFCRSWTGSVLWQATSPFRSGHRRKNWYVGISSLSLPDQEPFHMSEVRLETFRASGPGGQHVNTSDTAVRLVHQPTGLVAIAGEERSQAANRKLALARLIQVWEQRRQARVSALERRRRKQHLLVERGNPIRTFRGADFEAG